MHMVLRQFEADGVMRQPGEVVDAAGWLNNRALIEQRYIQPISDASSQTTCGHGRVFAAGAPHLAECDAWDHAQRSVAERTNMKLGPQAALDPRHPDIIAAEERDGVFEERQKLMANDFMRNKDVERVPIEAFAAEAVKAEPREVDREEGEEANRRRVGEERIEGNLTTGRQERAVGKPSPPEPTRTPVAPLREVSSAEHVEPHQEAVKEPPKTSAEVTNRPPSAAGESARQTSQPQTPQGQRVQPRQEQPRQEQKPAQQQRQQPKAEEDK